ncbi:transposase [Streptomyces sp. NPDC058695]|uniref:transposase n=1 Tax=Streptomyces sp. NPDC058695 TaxID=3346604 RepID=UPI00365C1EB2
MPRATASTAWAAATTSSSTASLPAPSTAAPAATSSWPTPVPRRAAGSSAPATATPSSSARTPAPSTADSGRTSAESLPVTPPSAADRQRVRRAGQLRRSEWPARVPQHSVALVEAHGIPPLAAVTTGGSRDDVTHLIPLIQAVAPIRGRRGRPLRRPEHLCADRGHDHEVYRDEVRRFQIARRGTGHGSGLGVYRWVVEGALALLHRFRRLRIRWDIRDGIHHAFVTLGCAVICRRRLRTALC